MMYISSLLLIVGCSKKSIDLELSNHSDQQMVIEGKITDSVQTQYINCSLTTNFGDEFGDPVTDAMIRIYTDEGIYQYLHQGSGLYASEIPFGGIYDQSYQLEVKRLDSTYSVETDMPSPIGVDTVWLEAFETGPFSSTQTLNVRVASEADQYIGYKLWEADTTGGDTSWTEVPVPIYWATPVLAAPNQDIQLPSKEGYYNYWLGDMIKIQLIAYSKEVGEYLIRLRDYVTQELPNSQFHNPPYFYEGDVYGMTYGIVTDEIIHKFQ